jgi:hypothetical protein
MDAFERRAREVLGEGREARGEGNGREEDRFVGIR